MKFLYVIENGILKECKLVAVSTSDAEALKLLRKKTEECGDLFWYLQHDLMRDDEKPDELPLYFKFSE